MSDPQLTIATQNTPDNFLDRIAKLERAVQELQISEGLPLEQITDGRVAVVDLLIAPSPDTVVTDPTDTGFTGSFFSGVGESFLGILYNIGSVALGVLQVGFNTAGKFIAGAGAVIIDATGISLDLAGYTDTTTPNAISWKKAAVEWSRLVGYESLGTKNYLLLTANRLVGYDSTIDIFAGADTGKEANVSLFVLESGSVIRMLCVSSVDGIYTTAATVTINKLQDDYDTIIKGTADANLIHVDASTNRVGIGIAAPAEKLDVVGNIKSNGTIVGTSVNTITGVATKAEQETATSLVTAVSPGQQQSHPSAAKCWGYVTVAGGVPTLAANYNVTSITDDGVGKTTVTIATDFSSTNYAILVTTEVTGGGARYHVISAKAAGTFQVTINNSTPAASDTNFFFACFGDQ